VGTAQSSGRPVGETGMGDLIDLDRERRLRDLACRSQAIEARIEAAADLVLAACGACRAIAALADFNMRVDQGIRLARFVTECSEAA